MSTTLANQPRPSFTSFPRSSPVALSEPYRILIASVHALLREGLRSVFESRPECGAVLEAASLPQVARALEQRTIDVLLLDCELVGHGAVKFLQSPRVTDAGIPILILASSSN